MRFDKDLLTRRSMMTRGAAALAGGAILLHDVRLVSAQEAREAREAHDHAHAAPARERADDPTTAPHDDDGAHYTPVTVPDGAKLPWKMIDGVKVFHLVAEPTTREFAPGLVVQTWGYNGLTHGPVIEVVEGDRCRFYVTNKLSAPTTIHWHGILLPNGMDGVGGLTQPSIPPGETFRYEFTFRQNGTFLYHPHFDEMTQIAMGMMGMLVVHPRDARNSSRPKVDRDFALMLSEWRIDPGAARPDPMEMSDFNVLTINAKSFPGTSPLVVKKGDRVRIRLGNLGPMDHHPIHLHGYQFMITGTDAGPIAPSAQWPETTVLVPVGSTRDIEFIADAPGDWAMHCHMTHHMMNQMGHDIPNMVGVRTDGLDETIRKVLPEYMSMGQHGMGGMAEMGMAVPRNSIPMLGGKGPFGTIDMGGMFTILKVRENLASYDADPGWYDHPAGTVASKVEPSEVNAVFGAGTVATPTRAPTTAPTVYTCPMHPEVVSNEPGRCPKCNMRLRPVER